MIPQVTPARLVALGIPACAIIVSADLLRFNNPAFAKLYEQHLGYLMRPTEKNRWNGVIFYLIGALLVLSLLPTDIATLSVLLLSWCDTAASLVGRAIGSYGPRIRRGKSLFGTLAAWLTGALTTAFFFDRIVPLRPGLVPAWDRSLSSLSLLQVSVLGGIVAAVSEAVDVFGLDDNLTIPVLSGGMLWAVLCWAGYGRA
jgi:diacylglycerol kinase (CTP)